MTKKENFLKGFIKENPIFVYLLGMCPALAVTSTLESALGMGILVIFVLICSNTVISLISKYIPIDVKVPAYIVIIATFVTIVRFFVEAYAPDLAITLGVFIPLIVVNCLILGRAESFASKNNVVDSAIDGLGMGLGFTFALCIVGAIRELLATGGLKYGVYLPFGKTGNLFTLDWIINIFDKDFTISDYGIGLFASPAGAFITIGLILATINLYRKMKLNKETKVKESEA